MKGRRAWNDLRRRPLTVIAMILTICLVGAALLAPILTSTNPNAPRLQLRLEAPAWAGGAGGLLGTDELGRDLLLRILAGLRTSLLVGGLATMTAIVVGTTVGLVSGYYGGLRDSVLSRVTEFQLAFPGLLFVLVLTRVLGQSLLSIWLTIGLISWPVFARVTRSAVNSLRRSELVTSTISIGARDVRIIGAHVLPNVSPAILSLAGVTFTSIMLAEAGLSFLGFGVNPPGISLGSILAAGRDHLVTSWWISSFAGLALLVAVLGINLSNSWRTRFYDPLAAR